MHGLASSMVLSRQAWYSSRDSFSPTLKQISHRSFQRDFSLPAGILVQASRVSHLSRNFSLALPFLSLFYPQWDTAERCQEVQHLLDRAALATAEIIGQARSPTLHR